MDIAISLKNVSKSYRMYATPAERLKELLHPFGRKYHQEFWALRDVSLEVKKGECVGIIGKNGSGKSTLLQVLCGILQPTNGEVKVQGRISALLELGAGFNPEFTGRENVYLNGALMGVQREEMDERFERITEFAEIGHFIDQPVKTYSSGMYVRLAFACAVNVDPDILIVDEALAVGDIGFRSKCYLKFNEIAKKCAVVIVTHDLPQVSKLCDNVLVLNGGNTYFYGDPIQGVEKYNSLFGEKQTILAGSGEAKVSDLKLLDETDKEANVSEYNAPLRIQFDVEVDDKYDEYIVSITIMDQGGALIAQCHSEYNKVILKNEGGRCTFRVDIDRLPLNPANYFLSIIIFDSSNSRHLAWLYAAREFTVVGDFHGGAAIQLRGSWEKM